MRQVDLPVVHGVEDGQVQRAPLDEGPQPRVGLPELEVVLREVRHDVHDAREGEVQQLWSEGGVRVVGGWVGGA